jgi:transcription initiation factor TFIIIB Brf1 subunit/transcription initiation factor TFIIB
MSTNSKITRKELQNILGVCEKTARKEYRIIIDSLNLKRKYLTEKDLLKYGL